jgi:paired amphipathic helix protein Sin3a
MTPSQRWSYYTASYITRQPTEGLPTDRIRMPFLERNRPGDPDDNEDPRVIPMANHEGLLLRICVNSYRMLYDVDTEDWFVQSGEIRGVSDKSQEEAQRVREKRAKVFRAVMVEDNTWMKAGSKEGTQKTLEGYEAWISGTGQQPRADRPGVDDDTVGGDYVMVDA